MPLTRRAVLRAAVVAPVGLAVASAAAAVARLVTATAPSLRPAASGTSATRCAACGATGHGMLDRDCPAAPRVL
jgi:hypothetical protein